MGDARIMECMALRYNPEPIIPIVGMLGETHDLRMNLAIRRMALRNAAKVALGTLVVGCGGSIAIGQDDAATDAKTKKDGAVVDASVVPVEDAALACTGATDIDASDVTSETFACCIAEVKSATGDASPWGDPNGPDASTVANNPAALNCCDVIVARIDNEPDGGDLGADYGAAGDALNWCCIALNYPMGTACTPWGPPTPPSMEMALEEVA